MIRKRRPARSSLPDHVQLIVEVASHAACLQLRFNDRGGWRSLQHHELDCAPPVPAKRTRAERRAIARSMFELEPEPQQCRAPRPVSWPEPNSEPGAEPNPNPGPERVSG